MLIGWGEESENHLVCDLNLGTKNTVKTQLRKTLAVNNNNNNARGAIPDSYDSGSELDLDDDDEFSQFGNLDSLDDEPSEEDESIAMMIQEMIKLKHQLQEEDEMIERLAVVLLLLLIIFVLFFLFILFFFYFVSDILIGGTRGGFIDFQTRQPVGAYLLL